MHFSIPTPVENYTSRRVTPVTYHFIILHHITYCILHSFIPTPVITGVEIILEITIPRGKVVPGDRKLCGQRVKVTATSTVPRF